MKRALKSVALLLTLAALLSVFVSCFSGSDLTGSTTEDSAKDKVSIVYDKKYREHSNDDGSRYFVFHSDHTGYFEVHTSGTDYSTDEDYTVSAKWEFRWAVADDCSVALFETKTTYYDDTTKEISFLNFNSSTPLTFGDGFLLAYRSTQYGDYVRQFVLEGSDLEQAITQD